MYYSLGFIKKPNRFLWSLKAIMNLDLGKYGNRGKYVVMNIRWYSDRVVLC